MTGMSAAATPPPLRRDRGDAVIGGVCAGLGRRLGIDPIVLRVVFIAATAAGGLGLVAYGLAWALLPAEGDSRAPALRVPGSRDSWSVATGIGMLMFAVLLLFREWGLWVGDALVWPFVLAAVGRRADLAPVGERRRSPRRSPPRSSAGARATARSGARRWASGWWSAPRCCSSTSTTSWRPPATWCCRWSWCWWRPR